jgi:hypothetical protein
VFCPGCKAPQIRVSDPSAGNQAFPPGEEPRGPMAAYQPPLASGPGIHWGVFFRAALPLSAISGFLTFLIFPIGLLVVFPLILSSTMTRYRRYHSGRLSGGQSARMGAFMALLSFTSFLVLFLVTLPWSREAMIAKIHELAVQNPDPQGQAVMLWFATANGFVAFTIFTLLFFLAIFLIVGMASGALLSMSAKNRS